MKAQLLKLFSRRFIIVLVSLITYGLAAAFPERAALIQNLAPSISGIVMVGLLAIGAEDAIKAWRDYKPDSIEDAFRKLTAEVLDSTFNKPAEVIGGPKG